MGAEDGIDSLLCRNWQYTAAYTTSPGIDEKMCDILSPIEETTHSVSTELASISIAIPYIRILTRTFEKNEDDSDIRTMKGELLKSLKSCFAEIEERKELCLATLLDPRFKD